MRWLIVRSLFLIVLMVPLVTAQPSSATAAQKAYLYEEGLANSPASRDDGEVVWTVETEAPAAGYLPEPVIKGRLDVPARGLTMDLLIRRNIDPTLSASHLIELVFKVPSDFSGGVVASVARFVLKPSEQARGESLIAVPARVSAGYFLIALDQAATAREKNEKLILESEWIDLPITYTKGRRALVTLALGETGRQVFNQALTVWRTPAAEAGNAPSVASAGPEPQPETPLTIPPADSKRVALVIGNNAYREIPALENPANDARDTAKALERAGFEVRLVIDATRSGLEDSFADFARSARDADAALIYYAGHGIQHNGVNYLIPVDGELSDETDLRRFIEVRDVISDLQESPGVKILILDACRDNEAVKQLAASLPKTRSAAFARGLADEKATGVLIAFAAQPDAVAIDGLGGRNSPFTAAFLKHFDTPGLELRTLLTRVRAEVYEATKGGQLPETSDSMIGEFRFVRN